MPDRCRERGAAMVEFALVFPLLIVLIMGIVEVGRAYHVQTSLSNAAREGVRTMALGNNATAARTAAKNAATTLSPPLTDAQLTISPATCTSGAQVTMTVKYTTSYITALPGMVGVGNSLTLTGKGTMRCNG